MKRINFKTSILLLFIVFSIFSCQKQDDISTPSKNERFKVPSLSDAKAHFEANNKLPIFNGSNTIEFRADAAEITIKWDKSTQKKYKEPIVTTPQIDILYTPIELNIKGNAKVFLASIEENDSIDSKFMCVIYTTPNDPNLFSGYLLIYNLDGLLENIFKYEEGNKIVTTSNNRVNQRNGDDGINGFTLGELLDWLGGDWFGLDGFITNDEINIIATNENSEETGDNFGNDTNNAGGEWSHADIYIPPLNSTGGTVGNNTNNSNNNEENEDWWAPVVVFPHGLTISNAINVDLSSIESQWLVNIATPEQLQAIANYLNNAANNNLGGGYRQGELDFLINVINNLIGTNTSTYDESNYPGKDDGLPFEWWLDEGFIRNSGNFNVAIDGIIGQIPNDMEIFLFMMFPSQSLQHLQNARTARDKTDELVANGTYEDVADGKQDAFRHAYWNALGTAEFGSVVAKFFGDAHEWNHNGFYGLSSEMDFYNNHKGRIIGSNYNFLTPDSVISSDVIDAITNGTLKYINENGQLVHTNQ